MSQHISIPIKKINATTNMFLNIITKYFLLLLLDIVFIFLGFNHSIHLQFWYSTSAKGVVFNVF